jgi:hypothetical protein
MVYKAVTQVCLANALRCSAQNTNDWKRVTLRKPLLQTAWVAKHPKQHTTLSQ